MFNKEMARMKKRIYALILAVSFVFCCMALPISAERVPTLTIESKKVKIGGEVEVALSIDGNPGIAGIVAELKYDKTAMTLVSMNAKADFGGTFVGDASQGSGFSWVSAADIKTDGVFATFKFRINDDATPGKYGIELEIGDGNTSNSAGDDVKFSVVNGSLSVIKFIPGDINDDEKVNVKDLVAFAQYLAKWDVKVNELALDVNCDGKVNVKDIVRLAQYLAGWDVSIGEPEWNGMTKLKGYESIDFGGRTFIIASRNDGQGYDTTPEVWVETITNDSYNDSVFERNKLMKELYNCTIEVDENGQNGYAADFASGGGKYIASTMQYGMPFTSTGYYNILSLDIDFTQDWWDQNYINDLSCNGKLYSIIGDFARKAMECTWMITFNKTVYENSPITDDIYQLVRDKKWTVDKMLEMCQMVLDDGNGDSKYEVGNAADSDTIGFSSSTFSYRAFFFGCGERYVTKDASGKFVNGLSLGKGSEVIDKLITLVGDDSYQNAGYTAYQNSLRANKVLFIGEVLNVLKLVSDTENLEIGALPFPLYDENQSRYYVHVNNHLPAYGIPTSFADTQILSDFWTLYAAHSKYTVREAFVNSCKYVWTSDEDNGEMIDIILDSRIYDPGYNWNMADSFEGYLNTMVESGRNQYTTIVERVSSGINEKIKAYEQRVEALSGNGWAFALNPDGKSYSVSMCVSMDSEIVIPDTYNGMPVTGIGRQAFWNCMSLKTVTIPSSVTSIGDSAFSGCSSLTSITIPSSVTSIDYDAFGGCSGLTSITIPSSVKSIGNQAFRHCSGLKNITVEKGNKYYHSAGNCLIETASKTLIVGCKNSVIPDDGSVTSIGDGAFEYCKDLTSITIPNSVMSVGHSAFYSCRSLTGITIPDSVTSIGNYAFGYCTSLINITVPDGVTSIGHKAFSKTTYYNDEANWTDGVLYVGNHLIEAKSDKIVANYIVKTGTKCVANYAFMDCRNIISITIPDSVTSIGNGVFRGCTSLANVTFGKNSQLASIGDYAFDRCSSLESITIPNGVTSIGDYAFYDCISLTSITIPNGVTSIGDRAVAYCYKLETITFKGTEEQWNAITKGTNWDSGAGQSTSDRKYKLVFEK